MWLLLALACAPWPDGDYDGDGFRAPRDCDDGNPRVAPDRPDPVGDGEDSNCDGMDGVDADGDGFASIRSGGDDCDDDAPTAHPGGTEVCNFVDDDCDGRTDIDAIDGERLYLDVDQDGWGGGPGTVSCARPDDTWRLEGGDCEDEDPDVHPEAPEPCGLDLSCDGYAPDCSTTVGLLTGGVILGGPFASSGAGWSVDAAGDVDGDGWPDVVVGAPADGLAWVLSGPFGADGSLVDRASFSLWDADSDAAGIDVAGIGDVDLDGFGDVLIGADGDDSGGIDAGAVWLVHGRAAGTDSSLSQVALKLIGEDPDDRAGHSVFGPGDVDGDGHPDLLVGAPGKGPASPGKAYLVSGTVNAIGSLGAQDLELICSDPGMWAGWAVAGGDMDGDGISDMVVGGPSADSGRTWAMSGFAGVPQNVRSLDDSEGRLAGVAVGDELGWAMDLGDFDGDGRADLWVSSPGSNAEAGVVWLIQGNAPPGGALVSVDVAASSSVSGIEAGERLGESVIAVPDIDGDGLDELALAGTGAGTPTERDGAVWVFTGGISGALDVDSADAWVLGGQSEDALGAGLGTGDLNLDGVGDLLIGAPGAGAAGQGPGQVLLLYGG